MSTKSEIKTLSALVADAEQRAAGVTGGSGSATDESVAFQSTLVAGAGTGFTLHNLPASAKFFFSVAAKNASTAIGVPVVSSFTPGSPGTFAISSYEPGTPGTVETGDASTYNILVLGTSG